MFGNKVGHLGRVGSLTLAQRVSAMFSRGEPGAWYDPSDLSTLFQDSAGSTPVTAVEQPVGRILDKSGRGNHATQATTTKRPVLSRRVNLLTKTEQFDDAAAWARMSSGTGSSPILTPGFIAPDGTNTAWRLQLNRGPGTSASDFSIARQISSDTQSKQRKVWIKSNTGAPQTLSLVATLSLDIVTAGLDWVQVTGGSNSSAVQMDFSTFGPVPTSQVVDVLIWHPEMVPVQDAHLPYQRVNTATDYDADPSKFPAYLRFDGVDDALQTGNIDFTSTDKMTAWAGVTKLSDAAAGVIAHAGVYDSSAGFLLTAPTVAGGQNVAFRVRRSALGPLVAVPGIVAPATAVVTGSYDGVQTVARAGGAQAIDAATAGTGTFASKQIFIGSQDGVGYFFNGRLYGLIVRGAQTPLSQIEATELYIKQKMRMP